MIWELIQNAEFPSDTWGPAESESPVYFKNNNNKTISLREIHDQLC